MYIIKLNFYGNINQIIHTLNPSNVVILLKLASKYSSFCKNKQYAIQIHRKQEIEDKMFTNQIYLSFIAG